MRLVRETIVRGALVVGLLCPFAVPAWSQTTNTVTIQTFEELRTVPVPDPCNAGQTIRVPGKVLVAFVTDIGAKTQSYRVRVRLLAEHDKTGGPDFDLTGEGEALFVTLLSGAGTSPTVFTLPVTVAIETDTTSETTKTTYGEVLFEGRVTISSTTDNVTFRAISSTCAG